MNTHSLQIRRFFNRFSEPPENVPTIHYRYHVAASYSFFIALLYHFGMIFIFYLIAVYPLALLNIFSSSIWVVVLGSHLKGKRILSISLALFEINLHAIMCVTFIGWGAGFQYYVLLVPLMVFFSELRHNSAKIIMVLTSCLIFTNLFLFFKNIPPVYSLEYWSEIILNYINMISVFFILSIASHYYSTATIKAEKALMQERVKIEEMASLLKKMFGRYLSTEVMNSLIENPSTLELGGEKRNITIMMTDLRGFTALSERLTPEQVVQMLNVYFEVMVEVILKYNGTINEIVGDALLIIFGAPQVMEDRAERAIACAIEMQNAMALVNVQNRERGLPELEMGIGLNDTEVVVGNIGTAKRSKYAAVGSGVNMTSRIESYSVGGQVLISESVRQNAGEILRIDGQLDVLPKGAENSFRIYDVGGIAGRYNLALIKKMSDPIILTVEIPLTVSVLEEMEMGAHGIDSSIVGLSAECVAIKTSIRLEPMTNLKMNLSGVDKKLSSRDFYGKVIKCSGGQNKWQIVRFTSVPTEIDAYFLALRQYTV